MQPDGNITIFVVEDDPAYLKFLDYILSLNPDFDVKLFDTGQACLDNLHLKPAIITLDYSLPDLGGEEILKNIKEFDPNIHVIIISGQEKIGTAVDLLKMGAFDYLTKDDETKDRLINSVNNARHNRQLINQIDNLKQEITEKYEFENSIIGKSEAIRKVFALIEKAVKTNITVSISGETGTGKELVAKSIHYNSNRKKKPFVPINLAAVPKDLVESELFGHEKGSFTGAITRRIGKFEEAHGGTIFLDEIGEMELNLQAKILRVIQEKELVRIGGNDVIKLDVRILVATHKNLAEEVKSGNFREDLYYRLLGLPVTLPPLRDRDNDVIILAKYFLEEFSKENNLKRLTLSNTAQEKLLKYHYPGNVRELKSIIDLAAVMTNGNEILDEDINFNSLQREDNFTFEELTLREYTFKIIRHFLEKYDDNVLMVAKKLDIGKSSIYRYIKEMEEENG